MHVTEVDTPPPRPRRRWLLALKVTVSAAVLGYLASKINFGLLSGLSWKLPLMLMAGSLINLGTLAIMASRWRVLIQAATGKQPAFRQLFGYYLVGAFYNNLLPGAIGGDFIRIKRLVDRHRLRWRKAAHITVTERLMGLTGIVLFVALTLPFAHLPEGWRAWLEPWMLVATIVAGALFFLVANLWLCRGFKHAPLTLPRTAGVSGLVLLGQCGDMLILALFLAILGTPLDPVNLIFSVSIAYLAAVLPISLGGLGVREGALTTMLGLNGVPVGDAALLAILLLCARLTTAAIGIVVDTRSSR